MDHEIWDCAIVGGGAAGLSAALVLGRARRRVLVLDAGAPSNLPSPGIGGLLGHDGRPPAELYALGREELRAYPTVEVRSGVVVGGERTDDDGFRLALEDGAAVTARRLVLATGMDYERPDLPGLEALWGDSVFHCPFCHGWEHRDQPLAVLADGDAAAHVGLLLTTWTDEVVVLTNGPTTLTAAQRATLEAAGAAIDERAVAGLEDDGAGHLRAVRFADGSALERRGLLVPTPLRQRSDLATELGAELTDAGLVQASPFGLTSVPGLFSAGDVSNPMPQVAWAIGEGSRTAAFVHQSLVAEDHGLPFPPEQTAPVAAD